MSMTEPAGRSDVEATFTEALRLHQTGRLAEAETLYRQVLAVQPQHADTLNLLGLVALQSGRNDEALEAMQKAIAISPAVADFHNNIGEAYRRLGRIEASIEHLAKAVDLDPFFVNAQFNLGRMLLANKRAEEAITRFRKVQVLAPDHPDVANLLGDAMWNRAEELRVTHRMAEAAAQFEELLGLRPDSIPVFETLIHLKIAQNNIQDAILLACRALQVEKTPLTKSLFVLALREATTFPGDPQFRALFIEALSEPWERPIELSGIGVAMVKLNSAVRSSLARMSAPGPKELSWNDMFGPFGLSVIANDELLTLLLQNALICDADLERLLTVTRFLLLQTATGAAPPNTDPSVLRFYCALARQCYLNDYVFSQSEIERDLLARARTALSGALQSEAPVPPLLVAAVASYVPLHAVAGAERLSQLPIGEPLAALIRQQIMEPMEERADRSAIPRLTPIEHDISLRVQQQYEENPYPSWVKLEPAKLKDSFDAHMRERFPLTVLHGIETDEPEILIAGCGTGQHSIGTARRFPKAKILAIDLSLSSLAYARRKTRELGVRNLDYAHADILKLGTIERQFDVVESSGVLHHLGDPWEGWRILLSRLRPGGFMRIGLYSWHARANVRAARDFIAHGGYESTAEGIRLCRQKLMTSKDPALRRLCLSLDFFSTSACRDLLFHVQEHQMTLPQIRDFLSEQNLAFLGFENLGVPVFHGYQQEFPDDTGFTNLDNWNAFEIKNPGMFGGMYQFWLQKPHS